MSPNSEQQYGDQTKNKQKKLAITHNIDAVESGVKTLKSLGQPCSQNLLVLIPQTQWVCKAIGRNRSGFKRIKMV